MRLASIVMNVPCSGPIWKVTRSGNLAAVSAIRSRSSASGGLEWATRYSCRLGRRCSDPEAMGSRLAPGMQAGARGNLGVGKLSREILHTPPLALAYWVNRVSAVMARLQRRPEGQHDGADTPAAGRDRASGGQPDPVRPVRSHRRGGGGRSGILQRGRRRLADPDLGSGPPAGT